MWSKTEADDFRQSPDYEEESGFRRLPEGWYAARVYEAENGFEGRDGDGEGVRVAFLVKEPNGKTAKVEQVWWYRHRSPQVEKIAKQQLARMGRVFGSDDPVTWETAKCDLRIKHRTSTNREGQERIWQNVSQIAERGSRESEYAKPKRREYVPKARPRVEDDPFDPDADDDPPF